MKSSTKASASQVNVLNLHQSPLQTQPNPSFYPPKAMNHKSQCPSTPTKFSPVSPLTTSPSISPLASTTTPPTPMKLSLASTSSTPLSRPLASTLQSSSKPNRKESWWLDLTRCMTQAGSCSHSRFRSTMPRALTPQCKLTLVWRFTQRSTKRSHSGRAWTSRMRCM